MIISVINSKFTSHFSSFTKNNLDLLFIIRYQNTHLSSTLTVRWHDKPGWHLKSKLCDYLRPKCHPIFYDSNINSAAVVRLNIYQAFLICAMKFHCYVCELSDVCRLSSDSYMVIILRSLRYNIFNVIYKI